MSAVSVMLHQAAVAPKESLSLYAGEWVLLRSGRVVAHDADLERLVAERAADRRA